MQVLEQKVKFFHKNCRINRHSTQKSHHRCGFWNKKFNFFTKIADLIGIRPKKIGLDAGFEAHEMKNLAKF